MVQEDALWPSSVIRLEPYWHNSKITWANTVNTELNVGKLKHNQINFLNMVEAVENMIARL